MHDVASSVVLDFGAQKTGTDARWIRLPYDLNQADGSQAAGISTQSARTAAQERWDTLLRAGAEFTTGVKRLDDLYKTSLINIFLLRTKYAGAANNGQDLYVVKPGAGDYDAFWYRDGAYLVTASGFGRARRGSREIVAAVLATKPSRYLRVVWTTTQRSLAGTHHGMGRARASALGAG